MGLQVFLYLALFWSCALQKLKAVSFSSKPQPVFLGVNSDTRDSSDFVEHFSDDGELVQLITFTRHGAPIPFLLFYSDEWKPYHIQDTEIERESLSPLGATQCWSAGRNMALEYGDEFFLSSDQTADFEFNYIFEQKSSDCAVYFWFGIQDYLPNIGYYSDSTVIDTFKEKGICPGIFEATLFLLRCIKSWKALDSEEKT